MAQITYRQALHDTLREALLQDENVFLMGEEIGNFEGSYKITAGLLKEVCCQRGGGMPLFAKGLVGGAAGGGALGGRPPLVVIWINVILLIIGMIVDNTTN